MNSTFWIITVTMAFIALSFLLLPVFLRHRKVTGAVWLAAMTVPSFAVVLYLALGTPEATGNAQADVHLRQSEARSAAAPQKSNSNASVASLVTGLEDRLRADPNDGKGWLLLAKSYLHLDRPGDAVVAYTKARELGQTEAAFELKLDGIPGKENISPIIRGRLSISDAVAERLDPNDSIFIFAKSTDGSALPVAVMRKTASQLPIDFELSDKHAMSETAKLSSTKMVTIIARVSRSGNAMQADPGLEVVSQPMQVGDSAFVELRLGEAGAADSYVNSTKQSD